MSGTGGPGRSYWIGYLGGMPVTERCFDACRAVEAEYGRIVTR